MESTALVAARHQCWLVAYLDDVFLIGARDGVDVAVRTLQALAPTKGLVLQPHKCVVTSICQAEAMAMADAHGFKLEPDGVQVLGAAVGNDALLRSIASVTTAKLVGWVKALSALDLPHQVKLLLARDSGGAALAHLPRLMPPHIASESLAPGVLALHHVVADAMGLHTLPPHTLPLVGLPTRMGGLGLTFWSMPMCRAAYVAGACAAVRLLHRHGIGVDILTGSQPDPAVVAAANGLQQAGIIESATLVREQGSATQADLARLTHDASRKSWLEQATPAARARLGSAAEPGAAAWLRALPVCHEAIPDAAFAVALKLWLGVGIPLSTPYLQCCRPGAHPLRCQALHKSGDGRHQALLQAWVTVLGAAGVAAAPLLVTDPVSADAAPAGQQQHSSSSMPSSPCSLDETLLHGQLGAAEANSVVSSSGSHGTQGAASAQGSSTSRWMLRTGLVAPKLAIDLRLRRPVRESLPGPLPSTVQGTVGWLGGLDRAARQILKAAAARAEVRGIPRWAYIPWAHRVISAAVARANAAAVWQHNAMASGLGPPDAEDMLSHSMA